MTTRSCLIIGPTQICGPTRIVGSDCPRSPFWGAPCTPLSLADTVCLTPPFVDEPALALALNDQSNRPLTLDEPEVILAP